MLTNIVDVGILMLDLLKTILQFRVFIWERMLVVTLEESSRILALTQNCIQLLIQTGPKTLLNKNFLKKGISFVIYFFVCVAGYRLEG